MSEWREVTWESVCELNYGKGLENYKHFNDAIPVFGSGGIIGTTEKSIAPKESVIVARKGTLTVYWSENPSYVIDTAFWLTPKKGLISKWAYYALKSYDVRNFLSGTGVPSISRRDFYRTSLKLPPLREQKAIVDVLSSLDDKIERNRRAIEKLEAMGKALFQSWFVDFDPVRAKAAGHPTELPDAISTLFPNELVSSQLGDIPKGWGMKKVEDTCKRLKVPKQYSNKTVDSKGDTPVLDQTKEGIIGFHSEDMFIPASEECPVITFANHTCNMRLMFRNFSVIQNVIPLLPTDYPTVWYFIRTLGIQLFEEYRGHIPSFMDKRLCFPTTDIAIAFENIVSPMFRKIDLLKRDNTALAELRDTILPKLMSGELRVKNSK